MCLNVTEYRLQNTDSYLMVKVVSSVPIYGLNSGVNIILKCKQSGNKTISDDSVNKILARLKKSIEMIYQRLCTYSFIYIVCLSVCLSLSLSLYIYIYICIEWWKKGS